MVRRAVLADESGAVEAEHDVQVLQGDVHDELVVGALQERRVDGDDRAHAADGEAGGEADRVLLGDADVVEAVGKRLGEGVEAGARGHRGGDRDDALVALGRRDQRVARTPR